MAEPLLLGLTFGRYVVRDILGSGAMGVVYRAYDPELDREIALKVLHKRETNDAAERLLSEAQAMARIRHPNVITVYDVGAVDAQVFLAMELIDGMTLDQWRQQPRTIAELLRVFRASGEGLRAAHAAGVVHRDFKPENILVGDDGRVCVTDFGLACLDTTSDGPVVGTAAYAAPEQTRGDAVDGRADQFSFCLALFEALYGTLPLRGRAPEEQREVERRTRKRVPGRGAPAPVRRVLRRGLQLDPAARFSDMAELLRALTPQHRLRLVTVAALAVAAVAAPGMLVPRLRAHEQIARCRQAEGKVTTLWSAARQAGLEHALAEAQNTTAWTAAKAAFDLWTRDWTRLHAETCELGARPDAESQSLFDLRMECLNVRWQDTSATLDVLTAQPNAAKHTQKAIASLQTIESCADVAALRRPLRPRATPEALRPITEAIARAHADFVVESCTQALAEATRAADDAHALGATVMESDARSLMAHSHMCLGDRDAARVMLIEKAVLAEQAQSDDRAAAAYLELINVAGQLDHVDDAQHWLQLARETITTRLSSADLQAELEFYECFVPMLRDRIVEAEPHCRRARELLRKLPKRSDFEGDAAQTLGYVLGRQGRFAEAAAAYRDAQQVYRQVFGPDSSSEIHVLEIIANDENEQDNIATALKLQARVLEHSSETYPGRVAIDLAFYGFLLTEAGRAQEAVPVLQRALAQAERLTSDHDYETGFARGTLGEAYVSLGQPQRALANLEQARRLVPLEGNEDTIAEIDFALAKALWSATSHHARALGLARQSLDYLRAHPLGAQRARHVREAEVWLAAHDKQ
jgi:tRNA A-37 threonylcarbamoyl transferase component Bud32